MARIPWPLLVAAAGAALGTLLPVLPGHAIPAFARRYETSCQTCHVAYPKLTPFGEAFRRNAYRFPGGGDATAQKTEPVTLGNDAQKERYPSAVWPGELPNPLPLSLLLDGSASYGEPPGHVEAQGGHGTTLAEGQATAGAHGHVDKKIALGTLGGHVGVRSAGTVGDLVAFLASVDLGGHEPATVERAAATFTPFDPAQLQLKVGRFEPALHGVSVHRSLLPHMQDLTTRKVASNPFAPEHAVTGVEASGVLFSGRLGWAVGGVENAAVTAHTQRKDAYARIEGKLGGMRWDGLEAEAGGFAWRERSLTLGASVYAGVAGIAETATATHDDSFLRAGLDLHATFDDLLLDLVAVRQTHDAAAAVPGSPRTADFLLAEMTWVASAVYFPTVRFDLRKTTGGAVDESAWTATLMGTHVIRPNVVGRVLAGGGKTPTLHDPAFQYAMLHLATAW